MEFDLFIHEFSYHVVRMSHMSNYGIFFLAIDSVLFIKYAYKRDSLRIEMRLMENHFPSTVIFQKNFFHCWFHTRPMNTRTGWNSIIAPGPFYFYLKTSDLIFLSLFSDWETNRDCTLNLLSQIETLNPLKQPAAACTVQVLDRPATEDRMSTVFSLVRCLVL